MGRGRGERREFRLVWFSPRYSDIGIALNYKLEL